MKTIKNIGLENVQAVYSGPEGDLWELVMGEQYPHRRLPILNGFGQALGS